MLLEQIKYQQYILARWTGEKHAQANNCMIEKQINKLTWEKY